MCIYTRITLQVGTYHSAIDYVPLQRDDDSGGHADLVVGCFQPRPKHHRARTDEYCILFRMEKIKKKKNTKMVALTMFSTVLRLLRYFFPLVVIL